MSNESGLAAWAAEMVAVVPEDQELSSRIPGVNLALNRRRLARFLEDFAEDSDARDLLLLDLLCAATNAAASSTGTVEELPTLPLRPFRLFEYTWLVKGLELYRGGLDVLDLGGPASHPLLLAALAGNRVTSVDINPEIVAAARQCKEALNLVSLEPRVGDMRDLADLPPESFDVVLCCSVLEHLTAEDQERSLSEMARVLRPGGRIGLTFDYGPAAPGANEHLPPPHEPPGSAAELARRYVRSGLEILGNRELEDPTPGSLFHDAVVRYAMGALFLGKPPLADLAVPRPVVREHSLLSALRVSRLPQRLYEAIGSLNRRLGESQQYIDVLESTAAERLQEMQQKDTAIADLKAEAVRRALGLESASDVIAQQQERITGLERTAAERLHEMEQKGAALAAIQAEADRRADELEMSAGLIREQQQRIAGIEQTAAERLEEMERKDEALAALKVEADRRAAELERAVATIDAQQKRLILLEEIAAERFREMQAKDTLIVELNAIAQKMH